MVTLQGKIESSVNVFIWSTLDHCIYLHVVKPNERMTQLGATPLCGDWYQEDDFKNYKPSDDELDDGLESHPFRVTGLSRSVTRAVF